MHTLTMDVLPAPAPLPPTWLPPKRAPRRSFQQTPRRKPPQKWGRRTAFSIAAIVLIGASVWLPWKNKQARSTLPAPPYAALQAMYQWVGFYRVAG
jgi:hypothetical protein